MTTLLTILAVFLFLYLATLVIGKLYEPVTTQDETHFVLTDDGWRLGLTRYLPRGEDKHAQPVLLHHGFTSSHHAFDLSVGHKTPSIAHWLADQGYDVWVCDLRGRGLSERKSWKWSVDDYIEKDDPAIVDFILDKTGFKSLHWIGHSMGGILLLCHCALNGSPKIASGIAVGSGLDYTDTGSHYQPLVKFAGPARQLPLMPTGFLSKLTAPFCGRWGLSVERFNYHPDNTESETGRTIYGGGINDTSALETFQMASLFTPGGLRSLDDKVIYSELAKDVKTPMLLINGEKDLQSSPALGKRTLDTLAGKQHSFLKFGLVNGHKSDYGHWDLLCGLNAEEEVYPHILKWLKSHKAKKAK